METKAVKRIASIERMRSSRYGNPRFRLVFTDNTSAATEPDASVAYGIENREFRGVDVEFTFNARGHVTHARPLGGR